MITRRGILAGLISGMAVGPAWAEGMARSLRPMPRPDGLTPAGLVARPEPVRTPEELIAAAKLSGSIGYVVMEATTGQVLEAMNADQPMPPASVTKAVTSLYALEHLGAGMRFATRVLATGPVRGGVVEGDLIIAGGGDPTLQTDQLGDLAARLKAMGIRGVSGRYLFWAGALPYRRGITDDQPDHVGYNPAISGLNLNYNRVHFEWKRKGGAEWSVAMDARGERFVPAVASARMKIVARQSPLFTYRHDASHGDAPEEWTVASAALGKGGTRWLPVRLPQRYLAEVFATLCKAQGISLPPARAVEAPPAGATELARVESAPLSEVLREMLRWSTNLTAECCGLMASRQRDLAASGQAMTEWMQKRFGGSARFVDHSGLGGRSRISARDMARMLLAARREGNALEPLLRKVAMRDENGKEIRNHPVTVRAKSGTLNFVSGLAGYVTPPSGKPLVFAIFAGDIARRDAVPVAERERPPGSSAWINRARKLQSDLIARWTRVHA